MLIDIFLCFLAFDKKIYILGVVRKVSIHFLILCLLKFQSIIIVEKIEDCFHVFYEAAVKIFGISEYFKNVHSTLETKT